MNSKLQKQQSIAEKVIRSPWKISECEFKNKNLWLLKPTGFNRGIGIHVFNSVEDLKKLLWTHYRISVKESFVFREKDKDREAAVRSSLNEHRQDKDTTLVPTAQASDPAT